MPAVVKKKNEVINRLAGGIFPWTTERKYLAVNISFLVFYLAMLLADTLGFYEMFRFVRYFCYFSALLFSFNILVFFIGIATRMVRVLMLRPTPPSSPLAKQYKAPSFLEPRTETEQISSALRKVPSSRSLPQSSLSNTPIKLMSSPRASLALSTPQGTSVPSVSATPLGPSTPFSLRFASAGSTMAPPVPAPMSAKAEAKGVPPPLLGGKKLELEPREKGKVISEEFRIERGNQALRYLSLSYDRMDFMVENLRHWFSLKIFKPLAKNITDCEEYFIKAGWGHLGPSHPVVYSLLSKGNYNTISSWEDGFVIPSTLPNKSFLQTNAPQTLLELAQKYKEDAMVTLRLAIEKYLDTGNSIAGHRITTIQHIKQLASDPWVRHPLVKDINALLVHLFCTFLDERLQSPFSGRFSTSADVDLFTGSQSKNFVAIGEPFGTFAAQTPKLHQVRLQEFRVLLPNQVALEMPLGITHVFQVIVLFLEYIRANLNGYLGIANLSSPSIDLMEVLKENGHYFK